MISYLVLTRNRPACLERTLDALAALPADAHEPSGGAEVVVVDNASRPAARVPGVLPNGFPVTIVRHATNEGAAGRNAGAAVARGDWIVMLDDDSHPSDAGHVAVLAEQPPGVAAVGADIVLPGGDRESGGRPEVFVGCGVALRRDVFVRLGGYDDAFEYYVEEYDLCARLIAAGWRVVHDARFRVAHEKTAAGRDFGRIVARLVRNNGWVLARYAPGPDRERRLGGMLARYRRIAEAEDAEAGWETGCRELEQTLDAQPRRPLTAAEDDRFTGRAHVRLELGGHRARLAGARVELVAPGKGADVVREIVEEIGGRATRGAASIAVVATLSPGPMLDAYERASRAGREVLLPWRPAGLPSPAPSAPAALTRPSV